jgi:hypothetical protein
MAVTEIAVSEIVEKIGGHKGRTRIDLKAKGG